MVQFRLLLQFVKGLAGVLCDAKDSMDVALPEKHYDMLKNLSAQENDAKLTDIFRIFDKLCKEAFSWKEPSLHGILTRGTLFLCRCMGLLEMTIIA